MGSVLLFMPSWCLFTLTLQPFIMSQQGREELFEAQLHSYSFKNMWGEKDENPTIKAMEESASGVDVEAQ